MKTSRRLRGRRSGRPAGPDLYAALATAESLQATIRLGDGKIASLSALVFGVAGLTLDRSMPSDTGLTGGLGGTVSAGLVLAIVGSAGVAAWHLMLAIRPQVRGPAGRNRFGYPSIVKSGCLPTSADHRRQRNEAWQHVAILADIAMKKHVRIRRCLPWVAVEISAGALLLTVAGLLPSVFG
jgi:hypothetical protein